ncbi:MAG: pentapeptide repeat-containing protein [Maricaulaceae bacterium]
MNEHTFIARHSKAARFALLTGITALVFSSASAGQIRVDARMHTTSGSCSNCDLSDRTMTGMTLRDSNFSGSKFNRSNLSGGNFDRTDLSNAQFTKAFLARVEGDTVNMAEANLLGATLIEAKLNESILSKTDLRRSDLTRSSFTNSDFTDANLSGAIGVEVNFTGSRFENARFDHMNLQNAKLDEAVLIGVKFGDAILHGATMKGAIFTGADLSSVRGLKQSQLDVACGDTDTHLPIGLSVPYCDSVSVMSHANGPHHNLPPHIKKAASQMDDAINNIEDLMDETPRSNPKLRRKLEEIHSDLISSRRAIELDEH